MSLEGERMKIETLEDSKPKRKRQEISIHLDDGSEGSALPPLKAYVDTSTQKHMNTKGPVE